MSIFKKKVETIIEEYHTAEVDGAEVWMVSWNALKNSGYSKPDLVDCVRVAKAFLNEEDADLFIYSLKEAMKLLQSTYKIDIKKELQA